MWRFGVNGRLSRIKDEARDRKVCAIFLFSSFFFLLLLASLHFADFLAGAEHVLEVEMNVKGRRRE